MTESQHDKLNTFFVKTFNSILQLEERALADLKNLSVKEIHVIEAVVRTASKQMNTMSQVADELKISVGALTTSVNTLVQKGYLERGAHPKDRRVVLVYATPSGLEASKVHECFHEQMISGVGNVMSDEELDMLTASLEKLTGFFNSL